MVNKRRQVGKLVGEPDKISKRFFASQVFRWAFVSFQKIMTETQGYMTKYGVDRKKVNLVQDQLERCGFLHGVQDVSNDTSIVILDIAKF